MNPKSPRITPARLAFTASATVLFVVILLLFAARLPAGWICMWVVAGVEFLALKLATLTGFWTTAPAGRVAAYATLWPGMNARAFLFNAATTVPRPTLGELTFALAKLVFGLFAVAWAVVQAGSAPALAVGWVGMIGIIFTLHFGGLHLVSLLWRRGGVAAPPIMRAPILATSLADFWGVRWNVAFAEAARRFVLLPLARQWGAPIAGGIVFLLSGLVHETVISFPARGGWGGPTFYFVLQGAGAWFEKTATARRLGLNGEGRGRLFTILVVVVPLPLLFHAPFIHHVILPLLEFLKHLFL